MGIRGGFPKRDDFLSYVAMLNYDLPTLGNNYLELGLGITHLDIRDDCKIKETVYGKIIIKDNCLTATIGHCFNIRVTFAPLYEPHSKSFAGIIGLSLGYRF